MNLTVPASVLQARTEVHALALPACPARPLLAALLVAQRALPTLAPADASRSGRATDDVNTALTIPVREAGRSLEDHLDDNAARLWTSWGEHDLLPLLARFAQALSRSARGALGEPADSPRASARDAVAALLFLELGAACATIGWFEIDVVVPFVTPFDPARHKAIERIADAAHVGLVVELLRPGRVTLRGSTIAHGSEPSHVVVGGAP